MRRLPFAGSAAVVFLLCSSARAVTFTVTSANDSHDAVINGICDDGTGVCTLRAAIEEANATAALDTIGFNIGSGTPTIEVGTVTLTALPPITRPIVIDGSNG